MSPKIQIIDTDKPKEYKEIIFNKDKNSFLLNIFLVFFFFICIRKKNIEQVLE
jgi:hypothetical protein